MNITDKGRRKGAETYKRNRAMKPGGGFRNPTMANAEFVRRLNGRCFCPPGRHNWNCIVEKTKCGSE
tara:strand:+ start:377 stop:577 length:201 start_codon:yes stop_codon:yes gene_type:complete